ncbi:helix-turn-helix transcriptional regulator [Paraburkholderia sp. RL17-368-BIF-A]|uniref:helix-turn-helix domain-containing protein n=1 Tax=Paraburkholderia sp. RL17-368-BIF-A TaxID=3031628 RepID=UPI0038C4C84C
MKKSEDALKTTTPLGFIEPSSATSGGTLLQFVVKSFPVVSHRGAGRSIRDVTAKYEADPVKRAAIERARGKLAARISEANGGRRTLATMRLGAGLSQTQLGERIGVPQSQIARLEAGGIAVANAKTIRKLREALGVSADEILDCVSEE